MCLPVSLRYLERLWGTLETFKFIGVTLVVSNLATFVVSWIEYVTAGSEFFVCVGRLGRSIRCSGDECADPLLIVSYEMKYHGQMALQTGVLVAFTQMIPEHQVQLFGVLKMRVKVLHPDFTAILSHTFVSDFLCSM